jgi:hypothetical protein
MTVIDVRMRYRTQPGPGFVTLSDSSLESPFVRDAWTNLIGGSRQIVATILDVYDFGGFQTVVDVGGGNGALLAEILARNPGGQLSW